MIFMYFFFNFSFSFLIFSIYYFIKGIFVIGRNIDHF
jgi:hypothetical protein